jgi:hypothetical protein
VSDIELEALWNCVRKKHLTLSDFQNASSALFFVASDSDSQVALIPPDLVPYPQ